MQPHRLVQVVHVRARPPGDLRSEDAPAAAAWMGSVVPRWSCFAAPRWSVWLCRLEIGRGARAPTGRIQSAAQAVPVRLRYDDERRAVTRVLSPRERPAVDAHPPVPSAPARDRPPQSDSEHLPVTSFPAATDLLVAQLAASLAVGAGLWLVLLVLPTLVVRVDRLHLGAYGLALPGVVFLAGDAGEPVLRHELEHQRQMRRYSPFGVAAFLGVWYGVGLLRRRHTFWQLWEMNPLERGANAAMAGHEPLPRTITVDLRRRRSRSAR